jgi:hypothetical protein
MNFDIVILRSCQTAILVASAVALVGMFLL